MCQFYKFWHFEGFVEVYNWWTSILSSLSLLCMVWIVNDVAPVCTLFLLCVDDTDINSASLALFSLMNKAEHSVVTSEQVNTVTKSYGHNNMWYNKQEIHIPHIVCRWQHLKYKTTRVGVPSLKKSIMCMVLLKTAMNSVWQLYCVHTIPVGPTC